ncbi:SIMPL domain-containing protein [Microbacterium paludicola]|uniref:SIMPL domain-containing protein n=1 Tax=Microbacterium paludicola TaxID=300019 RepID=UPI00119E9117|nr:SIMPL domain-containing protein [Microbacterium paludicola]
MSEVTITVRGEHESRIAPERATVHVTVRAEGAERSSVVERAMRLAEPVRTGITERQEAGSVVDWSSKRLSVRAERPWNEEGRKLAPVYYASIDFSATFIEVTELSIWISGIAAWDGVDVGWVNWHLTPQTRADLESEVASAAVGIAVRRAQSYASALGLETVTPVEIADTGLISREVSPGPQMMARAVALAAADSNPMMEYEPEDIVVSATVEARFTAH